jgi:nitrite reductase/ring-hydroxylating ferredoxin subunit
VGSVIFNDLRRREDQIVTTDSRTPAPRVSCLHRRHALTGAAVVGVGVPFLAACGGDDSSTASDPATTPSSGSSAPSDPATSAGGGEAATGLTSTADIPVGGGVIFADEEVVIVQPTEGEFLGWSTVCTHQGCAVSEVADGEILCPCHNSLFSIEDGSPTSGPASAPLEEIALTVTGDQISLA